MVCVCASVNLFFSEEVFVNLWRSCFTALLYIVCCILLFNTVFLIWLNDTCWSNGRKDISVTAVLTGFPLIDSEVNTRLTCGNSGADKQKS